MPEPRILLQFIRETPGLTSLKLTSASSVFKGCLKPY